MSFARAAWLALAGALAGACSSVERNPEVVRAHVLAVDRRGEAIDPCSAPLLGWGAHRAFSELEQEQRRAAMIGAVEQFAFTGVQTALDPESASRAASSADASSHAATRPHEPRRVVVFIHGGLNSQSGALDRAMHLIEPMREDGVYPIFINWQSSLFSSWTDHVFLVRHGAQDRLLSALTWPFVLAADVLRAIGRAPMTIYHELDSALKTTSWYRSGDQELVREIARELELRDGLAERDSASRCVAPELDIDTSITADDGGDGFGRLVFDLALVLPHALLGVVIDVGGTGSWEQMHRRTTLMLESEASYRATRPGQRTTAAVPDLFAHLAGLQTELEGPGKPGLQIDLVTHSMGCIVANGLLSNVVPPHATQSSANPRMPRFTNIVYMADADTVGRTERCVYGYMLAQQSEELHATHFYRLALHDRAEVAESSWFGIAPKGSLLAWIDQKFAAAPSLIDQRAGKLVNLLFSAHRVPPELVGRVHIKSFGFPSNDHRGQPTIHGDFSLARFWDPAFFQPRPHADLSAGPGADRERASAPPATRQRID